MKQTNTHAYPSRQGCIDECLPPMMKDEARRGKPRRKNGLYYNETAFGSRRTVRAPNKKMESKNETVYLYGKKRDIHH